MNESGSMAYTQSSSGYSVGGKGIVQRLLIDYGAAAGVDEHSRAAHPGKCLLAKQPSNGFSGIVLLVSAHALSSPWAARISRVGFVPGLGREWAMD
jgi:hypothetical protein